MKVADLKTMLTNDKPYSTWDKGVLAYALDMLEYAHKPTQDVESVTKQSLLCGADNWKQYAYGGCGLVYDSDIAARLCSPSMLKKCNYGEWNPSRNETWLDVEARALHQACNLIMRKKKVIS